MGLSLPGFMGRSLCMRKWLTALLLLGASAWADTTGYIHLPVSILTPAEITSLSGYYCALTGCTMSGALGFTSGGSIQDDLGGGEIFQGGNAQIDASGNIFGLNFYGTNSISAPNGTFSNVLQVSGPVYFYDLLSVIGTTSTSGLILNGSSSGAVTLQSSLGTYNFNLPTTPGTAGYQLVSGGGGTSPMTWASPSPGGIGPTTSAISASAIDWSQLYLSGGVYTKTLSANTTFTFSNTVAGQQIIVRLTNTASNYTVTWPSMKWPGGVAPTMTVGVHSDIYVITYDGTNYFGTYVQDF